jgi:hypothetical protein
VPQSGEENQRGRHERSASHVTRCYTVLPHAVEDVFADDRQRKSDKQRRM